MMVNEYQFEYLEKGTGDPVLFVHGSVSDYRTWSNQLDEFGKDYRAITYSRRYHWPNKEISDRGAYSMSQHVADLEGILKNVDRPVHLVGHSYGAFIVLLLAIKAPQLARSLVLAEPPVITLHTSDPPNPLQILKLLLTRPTIALAQIRFAATGLIPATKQVKSGNIEKAISIVGKAILGVEAFENLSADRKIQVKENFIKAEFLGSGFPDLNINLIRGITTPTLLLSGEHSPAFFQLLLKSLDDLLQTSENKVIANASHIMHEDNPDHFNEVVRRFIEDQE